VLLDPGEIPLFFLVPSVEIADYVSWQHQHWLDTRSTPVKETSMRLFRIEVEDPQGYRDNWKIFKD